MKKILASLILAAMCLGMCACAAGGSAQKAACSIMLGKTGAYGDAWVSAMNGESVKLKGEIVRCFLLADRSTIVALTDDGEVFQTTIKDTENRTTLAENVNKINCVRENGLFFTDTENHQYRMKFGAAEPLELGEDIAMAVADNTLSVLYADDEGNLFLLPEGEEEAEKIANWKSPTIVVESVSDDGKTALWVEKSESNSEAVSYLYHDGEKTKLTTLDSDSSAATLRINPAQTMFAVADYFADEFYFQNNGSELVKVKLSDSLASNTVYTANGSLVFDEGKQVNGLYIQVDADDGNNVYFVDMEGNRDKLLSDVQDLSIQNKIIAYIDADDNLRVAELDGSELKNEKKVAGDAAALKLSKDGRYLYYVKGLDTERNTGALYRYTIKSEEAEKIASETYIRAFRTIFDFNISYFYVSEDGKTVFYFEDVEDIEDTYDDCGTLKCATVGKEPVKIGTDIVVQMPNDGLQGSYVNASGFTYSKYTSVDADENLIVNWMFYNGKESITLAKDVRESPANESSAEGAKQAPARDISEEPAVEERPLDHT